MEKWIKYVWIVFAILAILFIIYQASTFEEKLVENPEFQETLRLLNEKSNELLELCMETEDLTTLEGCRDASIPNLIDLCKDSKTSTMIVCSESRINEFSDTIEQRIDVAQELVEDLEQKLVELEQKMEKLEEIPFLFFVSQSSGKVITEYPQLLRACIRYTEQLKNTEGMSEESIQIHNEDLSICKARVDDIRDFCEVLELCDGIKKLDNLN